MTVNVQNLTPGLLEMVNTVKRLSASERLFLAKALLDSLVVEAPLATEIVPTPAKQNQFVDEAIVREREAFIALHPVLLQKYPNEYVAIHNGKLVDHDKDGLALSLRIRQRFPNEFVWITPLKAQALEEWVMRSPRFEPITQ